MIGLNLLKPAINAIKHDALSRSLLVDQGKPVAVVSEPGEIPHKIINRQTKVIGNLFDLPLGENHIALPLATIGAALTLIPHFIIFPRHRHLLP